MSDRASDFRERARVEADRYGPDPWIFVRELLQNARDAGATAVSFEVEVADGRTQVRCRDDGEGMAYEHARRYLFSLYASSKEANANQVGRFGVGFWSILRFEPEHIVIRSCPRGVGEGGGEGWEVHLDGGLTQAARARVEMLPGTEVVLERAASDDADARRVFEAAYQNARFLGRRDAPDTPLVITVNGRRVNAPFALGAPSSAFRRGQVRGVVGLGSAPRVELFSRGLRVRSAACLDDLLGSSGHTNHSRVRFPELPDGLAPQALLESDDLELLLSRSDARDTRALRRLVHLGQDELRHLVERQLAALRPPSMGERVAGLLRRLGGESTWWRALIGATTGAFLAVLIARLLWPTPTGGELASGAGGGPRIHYGDLGKRYHGPQVNDLDPSAAEPIGLRFTPADQRPYFAALIVDRVGGSADPGQPLSPELYPRYVCRTDCLRVDLPIAEQPGELLRIPVPSGHLLEVDSLRYVGLNQDRFPREVGASLSGEAVLRLDADAPGGLRGVLRYRTGPGPATVIPARELDLLPEDLRAEAAALRTLPPAERVDRAIDLVRSRVSYQINPSVAALHDRALAAGTDFVTRTLEIGAGDCDVQNGLLVAVLQVADVDARLAVGWVGHAGGVSAWLHAWVEYLGPEGYWRVADATAGGASRGETVAALPPPSDSVAVGAVARPEPETSASTGGDGESPGSGDQGGRDSGVVEPETASPGEPLEPGSDGPGASPSGPLDRLHDRASALVSSLPRALVPWLLGLAAGLFALGLVLVGRASLLRTARRFDLDESGDLSSLLQGALTQPATFRHLPSLFHRRLVPLRGGAAISLARSRTLAADGHLYVGGGQTQLCRGALRGATRWGPRRLTVLDAQTPEGLAVAGSLGAIDLDRWGRRVDQARDTPALAQLSSYLREQGVHWHLRALEGAREPVSTLDLLPIPGAGLGDRIVFFDAADPWLSEAERVRVRRPWTACFSLLDHLLDHLDLGASRRAQLLAPLAARALDEASQS